MKKKDFQEKRKKSSKYFLLIFILLPLAFYLFDGERIKMGEKSIFTIPVIGVKDGGSRYKVGIGYGVYEWKILTTRTENGKDIDGYMVGSEILRFPDCYSRSVVFGYDPKIKLEFVSWNKGRE